MSLRLQLLAVGLLTLVLPWTGFLYVQEMEAALRAALEQSLLARAATVATALAEQSAALCTPPDCDPKRVGGISALVGMFFSGALSKLKAVSDAIFGDDGGHRSERRT